MTLSPIQSLSEAVESKVTIDNNVAKSTILSWCSANWRKIFAEFLATTMLIFLGCMTTVPISGFESTIYAPLGFGMVVMFNIQIFGHISGAFMNPAVTLSSVIFGKTSVPLGIIHIVAECFGAVVGYGLLEAVISTNLSEQGVCVTLTYPGQNVLQSLVIEIALTTALMLINCAVWDPVNKDSQDSVPIKFGLSILGLSLVGGPFTGASMNPARSLGPAVWSSTWTDHWIYWVGPFSGSIIGTVIYKFVFLRKPKEL